MRCVAQVEIDDYATRVLAKHWPDVPRFRDVRDVGAHNLPAADLICGGFPCQDISFAGWGAGLKGERSGLWYEFARIIGELRPRYVLVENVAALLSRGLSEVLSTLAEIGYDAEWHSIPAAAVGAPHLRERIFIVAHHDGIRLARSNSDPNQPQSRRSYPYAACRWPIEPDVGRVAHGVPHRVDRLRGLGNAVVPQVAEWIGRRIAASTGDSHAQ
jgi:DNA (cytosine-5)-methyltransferase 1